MVGCKKDLRDDTKTIAALKENNQKPVSVDEAKACAEKIGAIKYLECSAKANDGVREVFEAATRAALTAKPKKKKTCMLL